MKGVYISESAVCIEKETKINSVYDEILRQESEGKVIIKRYSRLSSEEKIKIFKQTVRAIHMQKLLHPSDHVPHRELADFVRAHFPEVWDVASKMTDEEINNKISEWRSSINNDC